VAGRTRSFLLETSLPGVFAAGDVRSGSIKRVTAATGEGAMAVRLAHEHLEDLGIPLSRWRCMTWDRAPARVDAAACQERGGPPGTDR
jgi:hypothetical protein